MSDEGEQGPDEERPRRKKGQPVDVALYERMAAMYLGGKRTLRSLSEAVGIGQETAQRAINKGWPERGWAALRERALIFDRQVAATTAARARGEAVRDPRPEPSSPQAVMTEAQRHQELRRENLVIARGLRMVAQNMVIQVQEALGRATAGRHGRRARVVEEGKGARMRRRVVWEDVVLPPRLTDLASALRDVAGIAHIAGEAESRWTRWAPPEGQEGRAGWESLSDEELKAAAEEGVLPNGVTMDQLRRRA